MKANSKGFTCSYHSLSLESIDKLVNAYSSLYEHVIFVVRRTPSTYILNLRGDKLLLEGL